MLLLAFACTTPPVTTPAVTPVGSPTPEFDRFCRGADWTTTTTATSMPEELRRPRGYLTGHGDYKKGTVESEKFVPTAPFHVKTIKVGFAEGDGVANIRVMGTQGRSYPAGYPDLDAEGATIAGPYEVEVDAAWGDEFVAEIDVSEDGIFLLPTQHYTVVNEYPTKGAPTLAYTYKTDENSRALLIVANESEPYGIDGDWQIQLVGETFCDWEEAEHWFGEVDAPFTDDAGGNLAMADLDGDGHDDLVTYGEGPRAWYGDGQGGFSDADTPFADASYASWMLFGDVDDDGDTDAYAASYIGADDDGDGVTKSEGDCNDADTSVYAGATETLANGVDDDCDGVADDGTDTGDADGDGITIADGDCDDTRDEVAPGLPEEKDGLDNDCDLEVEEDFPARILLNDGSGTFSALAESGVETRLPSTAAAFGDGNGDGNLDFYVGNWLEHYPSDAAVDGLYWEGNGDGTFVDAFDAAGLRLPTPFSTYGFTWNDYDADGDMDMLVANYHLYDNQLWQNQGDGTFVDVAAAANVAHDEVPTESSRYPGGHSYGGDFGDIDGDGDLDYFQANLCHPRTFPWADQSTLNISDGAASPTFTNEREARGLEYDEGDVQGQFGDYDNDGDLDLLVSSLYPTHYPRVYQNQGDGTFLDVTYEVGLDAQTSWGILWADVDEDGDLDLLVSASYGEKRLHLLENRIGTKNHWVELKLVGTASTRDAAGARVTVTAGGVTRFRDVQVGGGSFNQQRPSLVHLGLGDADTIESVTVRWVGGATETFTGVGTDGRWRLVEGEGAAEAL